MSLAAKSVSCVRVRLVCANNTLTEHWQSSSPRLAIKQFMWDSPIVDHSVPCHLEGCMSRYPTQGRMCVVNVLRVARCATLIKRIAASASPFACWSLTGDSLDTTSIPASRNSFRTSSFKASNDLSVSDLNSQASCIPYLAPHRHAHFEDGHSIRSPGLHKPTTLFDLLSHSKKDRHCFIIASTEKHDPPTCVDPPSGFHPSSDGDCSHASWTPATVHRICCF